MKMGVKTVYTNTPVKDVAKLMLDENIGGVPVVNLEEQMVGLVTRRNIVNGLAQ
jgi:CBS domain-containing protein